MRNQRAFTLIELMIAVAIVGILGSIAYPSYIDSLLKSRRSDTKGVLLGLANAMERRYTEKNTYTGAAGTKDAPEDTGAAWIYPIPHETSLFYTITIGAANDISFSLQAVPTGAQANDKCGTLTLTNVGVKGVTNQATGITAADCW